MSAGFLSLSQLGRGVVLENGVGRCSCLRVWLFDSMAQPEKHLMSTCFMRSPLGWESRLLASLVTGRACNWRCMRLHDVAHLALCLQFLWYIAVHCTRASSYARVCALTNDSKARFQETSPSLGSRACTPSSQPHVMFVGQ